MNWRWFEGAVALVLAATILVDSILFVRLQHRVSERRGNASALLRDGSATGFEFPDLEGYGPSGEKTAGRAPRRSGGLIVRYASQDCGYCERDVEWSHLASGAARYGFRVVFLLPSAVHAFSPDRLVPRGVRQIALVSMDWMRRFRITITPTLLVFGPDGGLLWQRQGVLSSEDTRAALELMAGTVGSEERKFE